ncbi:unnamed protein product [Didymodactylos carnosus]|uniref:Uncharacterized protein n=1 Tax=Didymodactylos carnosus TaxID=1234261 RepID=A0A814KFT1_9BILA|nr:unnamed protein product [Didymodactylos carnosus]CAF1048897.1 unnamed protein product [Didymodactylos carnosus]CAF3698119.1 unnamed protein product [Didymodactylos carnosus]CAF3818560.1 unnamed protein product [Didymodactylos carnosus]
MYSASIGRTTISVECYQPNIERIIRTVQLENVANYVILIGNVIYIESVGTIRFDGLLPIFIDRQIQSAIMKIDIQSSEGFLCASGSQIFDSANIVFVQMEWDDIKWQADQAEFIIDFFIRRNYVTTATDNCQILNQTRNNYTTWGTPHDVFWIKSSHLHLCNI